MKAKFVFESLMQDKSYDIIKGLIEDNVRNKNTRAKLISHLDKVYSFDENNTNNIDKKELTRIGNDFSNYLIRPLFQDRELNDKYNNELEELAKERGYYGTYDACDTKKDPIFKALHFRGIYYLIDFKRKYTAFKQLDLDDKVKTFIDKWYPNLDAWVAFVNKFEEVRSVVAPTKEEKQKGEIRKIKGKINPEIQKAIDEIAENFRKVIEKTEYDWYIRMFELFKEKFPEGISYDDYFERKNESWRNNLSRFIKQEKQDLYKRASWKLIENPEELAKKMAYETSVRTIQSWQFKMYNKLGGFVSELGKKFTTSVSGNKLRENDILFKFEDDSQFSIRNQIVSKVSHLGTYFYTYPTTFHNAFLPDGSKIASPNEFTVKKAFNEFK